MSQVQLIGPDASGSRIFKFIAFLYGMASYLIFFVTILYAIGFVMGFVVPKSIDTGTDSSAIEAVVINVLLMTLFAVQHSVMARQGFKAWWTQFVPKPVERSTYVLAASLCLLLLFWQWRPIPATVWHVDNPDLAVVVAVISFAGWVLVFTEHFPHQPFRAVRRVAGRQPPRRQAGRGAALPHAAALQVRASPDLSRLHHRVLGGAGYDRGPHAVRSGDHDLHPARHLSGGARPDRDVRRPVSGV